MFAPEFHSWHQYNFAGSITMVFASGDGLCPEQAQLRDKRRFARPRRGTDDQQLTQIADALIERRKP
jgi:hypothetical protein